MPMMAPLHKDEGFHEENDVGIMYVFIMKTRNDNEYAFLERLDPQRHYRYNDDDKGRTLQEKFRKIRNRVDRRKPVNAYLI